VEAVLSDEVGPSFGHAHIGHESGRSCNDRDSDGRVEARVWTSYALVEPGVTQLTLGDLAWYSKHITVHDASGASVPITTTPSLPAGPDPYGRISVQVVGGITSKAWYELSLHAVAPAHKFRSTPNHRVNADGSRSVRFTTDTTPVLRRVQLCQKSAGVLGGTIVYSERLPTASWGRFTAAAGASACNIVGLPSPTVGADGKVLSGSFVTAEIRCSGDLTVPVSVQSDSTTAALDGTLLTARSYAFALSTADLLDDGCRYWRP
jgi:hypothetical protein